MKVKHYFISAMSMGFAAGIIRILQYIWSIDPRGFYLPDARSDFLSGALAGLLAVGVLWSIFAGLRQKKEQAVLSHHFAKSTPTRVLFILLAILSFADGGYRIASLGVSLVAVLCLAAGLAWLLFGILGKFPPLTGLFPILQLGALLMDYFVKTHKYIQISEYALCLLGLCAVAYFALLLIKTLAGAECSKGRLVTAGCILSLFGLTSFPVPLAGGFDWSKLIFALHGFTYCLLAALTLIWLPESKEAPEIRPDTPDPQMMREYISDLPEVSEEEPEE